MSLSKPKSWKVLLVSLAAAVSFTVFAGCSNNTNNAEDTSAAVATYEGGTITDSEFTTSQKIMKLLSPDQAQYLEIDAFKEAILKQEVGFEYLASKVTDEAKKEAEKEADTQVATIKESLGNEYKSKLKEAGITEKDIHNYMVRVLSVYQDYLLKITDEQVKQEFEATKDDFTVATLRHVLIGFTDAEGNERTQEAALNLAKEAKAKLDAGTDFAEVAKEYSEDIQTKDTGGLFKDTSIGSFQVEEFEKVVETIPLNTISDPVETDYGYHILTVESRTEKTFDELTDEQKDGIKSSMVSKNLEQFMENELEGIIKNINLPKSTEAPEESGTNNSEAESTTEPTTESTTEPTTAPTQAPAASDAGK